MILGEYKQKVSLKNRIAFPKKFREFMGDRLIISRGYEGCLIILSPAQWEEMTKDSIQGPFVSSDIRDTRRFLFASASEIELDSQGRFIIPQFLFDYAALEVNSNGAFLGLGDWVELWSESQWMEKISKLEGNGSIIADRLSKGGKYLD